MSNLRKLAWVIDPTINMEKPAVVDEDDLLMKADNIKAKPIWHQMLERRDQMSMQ